MVRLILEVDVFGIHHEKLVKKKIHIAKIEGLEDSRKSR